MRRNSWLVKTSSLSEGRGEKPNKVTFFQKFWTLTAVAEMSYTQYTGQHFENVLKFDIPEGTFFFLDLKASYSCSYYLRKTFISRDIYSANMNKGAFVWEYSGIRMYSGIYSGYSAPGSRIARMKSRYSGMRIAPKQTLTCIIPIILIPDWSQTNAP